MEKPHPPEWRYSIAELARVFGTKPRTLRFYEERGLLSPGRKRGMRYYTHRDRARLQLILRWRSFGLSVSEIGTLLALYQKDDNSPQLLAALEKFRAQIDALREEQKKIDDNLVRLRDACHKMEGLHGVEAALRAERVSAWKRPGAAPPAASPQATAFRSLLPLDARRTG